MIRTNWRGAKGRHYSRDIVNYAKKNYTLLMLGILFLAGVFIGAMLMRSAGSDTTAFLLRVIDSFVEKRREQTLLLNMLSVSASSMAFVMVLFICGFCAISQPIILLLPFFRGLGFGFSAASLYANYGTTAIGFVALLILPDMLISSVAILLCCREALRLSSNFWGMMWSGASEGLYPVRIYIGRYVAASVLCVFSAFFEAVLYFAFANQFILG